LTELDLKKEVLLFYELEQLLIEYQITVNFNLRKSKELVNQATECDIHKTESLRLEEFLVGKCPVDFLILSTEKQRIFSL